MMITETSGRLFTAIKALRDKYKWHLATFIITLRAVQSKARKMFLIICHVTVLLHIFILFKCYFYLCVNQQLLPCLLCQSTHICHKYLFNYKKWCPHVSYCLNFVQKCTCPQVVFIINYNMFLFSLTMT